jgi:hypothetical protein
LPADGATATAPGGGRDPHTIFYQGNTAYKDGDYETAAREYERLLAAGFDSGAVEHNLGNAYFKRGEYGRAILAYERARVLLPRDADVAANLAYARESAKVPREQPPLWQRVVFAPALSLATRELAILCAVVWWAACGWLALRMLGRGGEGMAAAGGAAVIGLVVVAASLVFRIRVVEGGSAAVVVAKKESVARFEPSATGKEYFRAPEGSVLTIRSARPDWLQVARADGVRGWMRADEIEPIAR